VCSSDLKTGTITCGNPEVIAVIPVADISENEILAMAASVEKGSLHPLALAVLKRAAELGLDYTKATDIHTEAGQGITARVDGALVEIMTSGSVDDNGYSNVDVYVDGSKYGVISFTDRPRAAAKATVQAIANLGIEKIAIISGDQFSAVKNTAEAVGIIEYYASQKPIDKLEKIKTLAAKGVVYIGDGINDAPALKAADTGIAMGIRAADIALETADIVLMNDKLEQLPFLIRLSRKMSATIKASIWLSFGVNFIAVLSGAAGLLTPISGAIAHNLGSILVVALATSIRFTNDDV
jgi:Cd2+/Zn2+-exporting ATPase